MATVDELPAEVAAYRGEHRARHIGPRYRGRLHLATTTVGALTALALAAWQAARLAPSWAELTTVPVAFLVANLGEYAGHRGPMHHRGRALAILHERHTRQHHRFFTADAMVVESSRDYQMVLFPPIMLVFFLGAMATPIGVGLGLLVSPAVGWLFAATAIAYFLTYEWLHLAYHLPPDGWLGRRALVRRLRRHHTVHHDPRWMARANFNITFPIADRVFGTVAAPRP